MIHPGIAIWNNYEVAIYSHKIYAHQGYKIEIVW